MTTITLTEPSDPLDPIASSARPVEIRLEDIELLQIPPAVQFSIQAANEPAPVLEPMRGGRQWRAACAIARFTLLEAVRSRFVPALLVILALIGGAVLFALDLSLLERKAMGLALAAPMLRLAAVLVVAVFAIAIVSRELADRTVDLSLAAPLPRATWVTGKWLGLAAIAVITAVVAALPLALAAPWAGWLLWAGALLLELVTVAGVALLLAITFANVAAALLGFLCFYAAARLIGVFLLLQQRAPLAESGGPGWLNGAADALLAVLSWILPRLDLFARTDWLLAPLSAFDWAAGFSRVVLQTALYAAVVLAVGCYDFRRRQV